MQQMYLTDNLFRTKLPLSLLAAWTILLLSADNFCNSLDPDQDGQNAGPHLDSNHLTLIVFLKELYEKVNFEKCQQTTKKHEELTSMQRVKMFKVTLYQEKKPLNLESCSAPEFNLPVTWVTITITAMVTKVIAQPTHTQATRSGTLDLLLISAPSSSFFSMSNGWNPPFSISTTSVFFSLSSGLNSSFSICNFFSESNGWNSPFSNVLLLSIGLDCERRTIDSSFNRSMFGVFIGIFPCQNVCHTPSVYLKKQNKKQWRVDLIIVYHIANWQIEV